MPKLHEPISSSHRTEDIDKRMDRLCGSSCIVLSAFLGRFSDQRGRADLPVVQHAFKINSAVVVASGVLDLDGGICT